MYTFLKKHHQPISLTDEHLARFEKENGIQLPSLLKEFYLHFNGIPMYQVTLMMENRPLRIERIFPLTGTSMAADHILDIYRMCNFVPETFLPLAFCENGDDLFVDTVNDGIYLVPLEKPFSRKKICPSLEQFFKLLDHGTRAPGETVFL